MEKKMQTTLTHYIGDFSTEIATVIEKYSSFITSITKLLQSQIKPLETMNECFDQQKLEEFSHGFS